ncbi:S8 family serine peptidase [Haloterrigena alkaliphila]|uniref:S8 family serine peptidase n=1 Tax=Haloterrigena alkaliphila TaxID=2816475 RepID=A0A8A2V8V3_9EURY|nr:S8 family serine peptidase [Haloterrigena alkaliphila]QSW98343.1 S8 family serine peptidase [Haloterrigena alkaliphila]
MTDYSRRTVLTVSGGVLGGLATGTTVTAAARRDRFVVETRGDADLGGLEVVHEMPGVTFAVVRGDESELRRADAVRDYAPDIELELEEPTVNEAAPTVDAADAPDDPLYPYQWDKQALDVPTAHETTRGEGTRVAIIDTGVAADHPDLEVDEELSRNFTADEFGAANAAGGYHGTHVGGIVAAETDNGKGVTGTAPATDLVDCRVFSPDATALFGDILAAMVYSATIDADVANLSLGAYPVPRNAYRDEDGELVTGHGDFYGKVLTSTTTHVNREGTLLVMAAGNADADLQHDGNVISLPNEAARSFSVSATGPIGFGHALADDAPLQAPPESPATYTNYGTNAVAIGAPGGDFDQSLEEVIGGLPALYYDLVFSTISEPVYERDEDGELVDIADYEHSYSWAAGTSMAAPQVAGAAALVKSVNPEYGANQVRSALTEAAEVPDGYDKEFYGSGFLNILDAL